ncbi:MAG: hypothetical protein A4E58_00370 [Syntrophorhabdus sp. PtaB.Bin006]|nr:MAG: hypothetical protein A4E58_00370 [Syntrophorhabdus sp. PtaB.Bin006]
MEQQAIVGRALNVGLSAQGIHPTACYAYVPEQQLKDRHGTHILDTVGRLGNAHCIEDCPCPVRPSGTAEGLGYLKIDLLFCSGDSANLIDIVPGIVFFQKLENTPWIA